MRKLLLQMQMSIDGYVADKDGGMDWMVWNYGDNWTWESKLRDYHTDLLTSIDCILLSRKMAEQGFSAHWAALAQRSDHPQSHFAESVTKAQKVVFTKTLVRSVWENTTLAKGNLVDEIVALKQISGKEIIAFGGAGFAASLIKAGLVDEFHLIINPVVLGAGLSPFKEIRGSLNLHLVEATPYAHDIVVVKYAKKDHIAGITPR